jgi:hypothetical protein
MMGKNQVKAIYRKANRAEILLERRRLAVELGASAVRNTPARRRRSQTVRGEDYENEFSGRNGFDG